MMSVDALVTKTGIKMVSNLHTNTMVKGKIQLSEGKVLNAEWDLPEDKMEIISVKLVLLICKLCFHNISVHVGPLTTDITYFVFQ